MRSPCSRRRPNPAKPMKCCIAHVWCFDVVIGIALVFMTATPGAAQTPVSVGADVQAPQAAPDAPHTHEEDSQLPSRWVFSEDGIAFGNFNHQGSPRGQTDFRSQNWGMITASHRLGPGRVTLTAMFTFERLTAPRPGYSEIL